MERDFPCPLPIGRSYYTTSNCEPSLLAYLPTLPTVVATYSILPILFLNNKRPALSSMYVYPRRYVCARVTRAHEQEGCSESMQGKNIGFISDRKKTKQTKTNGWMDGWMENRTKTKPKVATRRTFFFWFFLVFLLHGRFRGRRRRRRHNG